MQKVYLLVIVAVAALAIAVISWKKFACSIPLPLNVCDVPSKIARDMGYVLDRATPRPDVDSSPTQQK